MTQADREPKDSEQVRLSLPIRVLGFDEARGRFIEDTHTILVSPTGSLIGLKHRVFPADTIRIINLENMEEADFRVVGPSIVSETEVSEWGVECVDKDRRIWGPQYTKLLEARGKQDLILIECRACHEQHERSSTLLEIEVLEATGMIALECARCKKPTYWTYAETDRRPQSFAVAEAVAPPPRVVPIRQQLERRARKRVRLKLPVLVRNERGEEEIRNTEDISRDGLAVSLAMELSQDEIVTILCPYSPTGLNIEQKAAVRWSDPYPSSGRRYYGFQFIHR